eukprot:CAMPEP_0185749596 /NCGR_PEP_ID=MMETSP1174-20130828/8300_1 /TAXON_ID=35687 /ORGANISM="Dictyocha speculum, Strain CCMP1381" /LENGTH=126 /DNA_ID=CAMNT_0028425773 /DNA_START=317 /DNA_END=697 /DNA_ORIENTATION=+
MGNETFQDEAFRQFQKDVAALARMSGQEAEDCSDYEPYFRAQKAARESTSESESESESIESLPANSYGAAVQRIPLEVWRLRDDDDPKEWSSSVSWATNLLNVVNPHFVRRSERRVGPKANTGKTV